MDSIEEKQHSSFTNAYKVFDLYREISFDWNVFGRNYDPNVRHVTEYIRQFRDNLARLKNINNFIPDVSKYYFGLSDDPYCRIFSWNVRYFTNEYNSPNIGYVVSTILKYSPHIVALQEISLGPNRYYDSDESKMMYDAAMDKLLKYYDVVSVCSSPPAFFSVIYGNMVLIKKDFKLNIMNEGREGNDNNFIDSILCMGSTRGIENRCFLGQQVFTYNNVPPRIVSDFGPKIGKLKYQEQNNENKCFIKIILPMFDLICVHLDAYSKDSRIEQLKQINNEITRKTIIVGDFNFFDVNDFLGPIKYLERKANEMDAMNLYRSWTYNYIETDLLSKELDNVFYIMTNPFDEHNIYFRIVLKFTDLLYDHDVINFFKQHSKTGEINIIYGDIKSISDQNTMPLYSNTYMLHTIQKLKSDDLINVITTFCHQTDAYLEPLNRFDCYKSNEAIQEKLKNANMTPYEYIKKIFDLSTDKIYNFSLMFRYEQLKQFKITDLLNAEYINFDDRDKKNLVKLLVDKSCRRDSFVRDRNINDIDTVINLLFDNKNDDIYYKKIQKMKTYGKYGKINFQKTVFDKKYILDETINNKMHVLNVLWDKIDEKIVKTSSLFNHEEYKNKKYSVEYLLDRKKIILDKINAIYNYFISTDESHNVFSNIEFDYCIKNLRWKTFPANTSINLSQWSGTRVDMAFYINFETYRPPFFRYYVCTDIDKGSDHLPLLIDVYKDIDFTDLLNITKIEAHDQIINIQKIQEENKIVQGPTIDCTKIRKMDSIQLRHVDQDQYNCQPCTINSYDWILNNKFNPKKLSDPHVSGGNSGLTMGYTGVYTTTMYDSYGYGLNIITDKLKNMKDDASGRFYGMLMFEFKFYSSKPVHQINIGDAHGFVYHDVEFAECYDKQFDILTIQPDSRSIGSVTIYKFPEHSVERYLTPKQIYLVGRVNIVDDIENIDRLVKKQNDITISDHVIRKLVDSLRSGYDDEFKLNKVIRLNCKIICNIINFINDLSVKTYHKLFINFDENRLQTHRDLGIIKYPVNMDEYGQYVAHGGRTINYYNKYLKYKHKYLHARINN